MLKACNSFKLKTIVSGMIISFFPALGFSVTKPTAPKIGDFTSYLKTAADCTADHCPTGAYAIQNKAELNTVGNALIHQNQDLLANSQWTNNHYALLLKPGAYDLTTKQDRRSILGFYTQIVGLGMTPDAVSVTPGIEVYNNNCPTGKEEACEKIGALDNFWRSVENVTFANQGTSASTLRFAVSQASPLRSVHVTGTLLLCDWQTASGNCGWSSGGFMANSVVEGPSIPGSQQQWIMRNDTLKGGSESANWNMVLVGTNVDPALSRNLPHEPGDNKWINFPVSKSLTPSISEKPYLVNTTGQWQMIIPGQSSSTGAGLAPPSRILDMQKDFYAMGPDSGTVDAKTGIVTLNPGQIDTVNNALASGKHLIIMPGVYNLAAPLVVSHPDTIVYGLGVPTLVCQSGTCMNVSAEQGVKLAGILFEAGTKTSPNQALLQVGNIKNDTNNNSANPDIIYDTYVRVAETQLDKRTPDNHERTADTGIIVNANDTIGDNLWIWRGDHDKATGDDHLTTWKENPAKHGLVVYGQRTIFYGLAVEHFQDYQTMFYGNDAKVYFYQSEMPYDVLSDSDWTCSLPTNTKKDAGVHTGCASYWVSPDVTHHTAEGLGVYTYFAFAKINPTSAIKAPHGLQMTGIVGRWLNGIPYSGIQSLVEDFGSPAMTEGYGAMATSSSDPFDLITTAIGEYKDPVDPIKKK